MTSPALCAQLKPSNTLAVSCSAGQLCQTLPRTKYATLRTALQLKSFYWVTFRPAKWGYILFMVFGESPRCARGQHEWEKALQLKGALTFRHFFITTTVYISQYILSISIIKFEQIICLGFMVVCH